ncbi:hypothetical protein Tco_1273308 [Tanacetum coccineum]
MRNEFGGVTYVAAGRACQQALWMKQAIKEYYIHCKDVLVLCDNKELMMLMAEVVLPNGTEIQGWNLNVAFDVKNKRFGLLEMVDAAEDYADYKMMFGIANNFNGSKLKGYAMKNAVTKDKLLNNS